MKTERPRVIGRSNYVVRQRGSGQDAHYDLLASHALVSDNLFHAKENFPGITHPAPTKAVVKQVIGAALPCGYPNCVSPLHLQDNNAGKLTRNSEMTRSCANLRRSALT